MPGICLCITARIMLPINYRYHCSIITKSIIDLRRETTALAQRCGIAYSGRYCDSNLVRLNLLRTGIAGYEPQAAPLGLLRKGGPPVGLPAFVALANCSARHTDGC